MLNTLAHCPTSRPPVHHRPARFTFNSGPYDGHRPVFDSEYTNTAHIPGVLIPLTTHKTCPLPLLQTAEVLVLARLLAAGFLVIDLLFPISGSAGLSD